MLKVIVFIQTVHWLNDIGEYYISDLSALFFFSSLFALHHIVMINFDFIILFYSGTLMIYLYGKILHWGYVFLPCVI